MVTKEKMVNDLIEMRSLETIAKNSYDDTIEATSDPVLKSALTAIRDEEIGHIKIVDSLIALVRG